MKKLLFFLAIACCAVVTARAYTAADSAVMAGKLSVTTQMFLNDRSAAASQQQPEKAPSMPRGLVPASRDMARAVRVYAQPEQVGGRQYVPCSFAWLPAAAWAALRPRECKCSAPSTTDCSPPWCLSTRSRPWPCWPA